MFRRPLLGGLNRLWQLVGAFDGMPPIIRLPIPREVKMEISRFVGLIPLAYMNFRSEISPCVTASDASTTGGGVTASLDLTPFGVLASNCPVRGDIVESADLTAVLTVGLFDGIAALRVAADVLQWNAIGHISVEKSPMASRVVESRFPQTLFVQDVQDINEEMVKLWPTRFSQASLTVLGGGPPCQGVSGLNAARKGALKDERSCLFVHIARVRSLLQKYFPWAQVRSLMENVASMCSEDEEHMSRSFGEKPVYIDAAGVSLARRPRLYWIDWEVCSSPEAHCTVTPSGRKAVELKAQLDPSMFCENGWTVAEGQKLCTFTTSRPMERPGYKPAGIQNCTEEDFERWRNDKHRFPPYQHQAKHLLTNKKGDCLPKKDHGSILRQDTRLSLIGNSWNVTVVAWLLSQL